MAHIFEEIDLLSKTLKGLMPLDDNTQLKLDEKFRLEFSFNSNHLEGNTLTYDETRLLLIFGDTQGSHTMREYEEMQAHNVAYHMIYHWAKDDDFYLKEKDIKNLNEIILVKPYWKDAITNEGKESRKKIEPGNYKQFPNSVRLQNGEIFEYATVTDTPILMGELIDWYRKVDGKLNPITVAALLHYKFVRIHPFDDGNGRLARLLLNFVLLKNNLPPVIIKSSDKKNYLRMLHLADNGNRGPFISYVASLLKWSLKISISAAKGESIEEPDDIDKRIELFKRSIDSSKARKKKKSKAAMFEVLSDTGISLFGKTYQRLHSFTDLFFSFACRVLYSTGTNIIYDITNRAGGHVLLNVNSNADFVAVLKEKAAGVDFGWIGMEYFLEGYKLTDPFDAGVFLLLQFDTYQYSIVVISNFDEEEKSIRRNYDEMLSVTDIDDITKQIAESILAFLKRKHFHK